MKKHLTAPTFVIYGILIEDEDIFMDKIAEQCHVKEVFFKCTKTLIRDLNHVETSIIDKTEVDSIDIENLANNPTFQYELYLLSMKEVKSFLSDKNIEWIKDNNILSLLGFDRFELHDVEKNGWILHAASILELPREKGLYNISTVVSELKAPMAKQLELFCNCFGLMFDLQLFVFRQ